MIAIIIDKTTYMRSKYHNKISTSKLTSYITNKMVMPNDDFFFACRYFVMVFASHVCSFVYYYSYHFIYSEVHLMMMKR